MVSFTFGFSTILLHISVYISDFKKLIRIILRITMYLTGVFYDVVARLSKKIGVEKALLIVRFNPMATVMISARDALYYKATPSVVPLIVWCCIGILTSVIGILIIYKNENNYVKVI